MDCRLWLALPVRPGDALVKQTFVTGRLSLDERFVMKGSRGGSSFAGIAAGLIAIPQTLTASRKGSNWPGIYPGGFAGVISIHWGQRGSLRNLPEMANLAKHGGAMRCRNRDGPSLISRRGPPKSKNETSAPRDTFHAS